jgi:hypothetical protein
MIAGGKALRIDNTSAVFREGGAEWSIFGAVQKRGESHQRLPGWSVGEKLFEILAAVDPISNELILPYSDPVPNAMHGHTLPVRVCAGEYKSASFVIRAGNKPLKNVSVALTDLFGTGNQRISAENVDIRGVKCWYQAGANPRRDESDKKRLTPELLLHDLDLVRVDHNLQVNLVRDVERLQDSGTLLPFTVEERSNQQIFLTLHVPDTAQPGKYEADVSISLEVNDLPHHANLHLSLDVLPYRLADVPIEYALFYLARFDGERVSPITRAKNAKQMYSEFLDMREHGLTNVTFDHQYEIGKNGRPDFSKLEPAIQLFRKAGFTTKRFLYVDWQVTGFDNETLYRQKIGALKALVSKYGFDELLIYGKDEQSYEDQTKYSNALEISHESGVKNFVATDRSTAYLMKDFFDYVILPRSTSLMDFDTAGGNLVVNGNMKIPLGEKGVGWVSSNGNIMAIADGKLIKKRGREYAYFVQTLPIQPGKTYDLGYTVSSSPNRSDMGLFLAAGGGGCVDKDIPLPVSVGRHTVAFVTNGYRRLRFGASPLAEFELTGISVKETNGTRRMVRKTIPWAYNDPQAGMETPATYGATYGVRLLQDGYEGVCNFAYQSGGCWNDWVDPRWRPHCMTYPTVEKPISTLQWEGWREAINSVRHLVSKQ